LITAVIGIILVIVGIVLWVYLHLIQDEFWYGIIALIIFLSGATICLVLAGILHMRQGRGNYGAPAYYAPQQMYPNPQAGTYPGTAAPYDMTPAPAQQPTSFNQYTCPTCNRSLKYINTYQKWLCENCNRWF
jgi:energy-converting hydrogenase Eha subunit F